MCVNLASWCASICGGLCRVEGCNSSAVVNWPSGLRRQFKALVRKGVCSNPTLANASFFSAAALSTIQEQVSCLSDATSRVASLATSRAASRDA